MVVVDSYTTAGGSWSDGVGGGTPPASYENGTYTSVMSAVSGQNTVNQKIFPHLIPTLTCDALTVDYNLYVRGKQYMKCVEEEDVSLATRIRDTSIHGTGWRGTIVAYEILGDGSQKFINLFFFK